MNHCVPGFHEMVEDCSIPACSGFCRPRKLVTGEDEIMELLWQNGPVVVQRSSKKSPFVGAGGGGEVEIPAEQMTVRGIRPSQEEQHLFMQEDEMASWLQYPIDDSSFDRDLYSDLLYSAPPPPPITTIAPPRTVAEIGPQPTPAPPRPPIPPPAQKPNNSSRFQNFVHFSRHPSRPRIEPISKPSVTATRESTEVESNETPLFGSESRVSYTVIDCRTQTNTESITPTLGNTGAATGEMAAGTCELTMTSSPGGSGSSFSAIAKPRGPRHKPTPPAVATEDRKRKSREEADINECQSEDVEFEAAETKRQARGSASIKRSRAAEVHNLSERRRRDRINEKMRALQELIPRCNKSDKASMLDEAIEYLKSLQMQVQMMMSMGCGMVPMMYPGMQQYMPAMGMGMDMAMNRPMMPYPTIIPGSGMPNQAAAQMNPRFHMPAFHLPPVPVPDPSRIQASNQPDPMLNSLVVHNPNQPQMPNFIDPYQQFPGLRQAQLPLPQNQASVQLSTCKDIGNPENQQSG